MNQILTKGKKGITEGQLVLIALAAVFLLVIFLLMRNYFPEIIERLFGSLEKIFGL